MQRHRTYFGVIVGAEPLLLMLICQQAFFETTFDAISRVAEVLIEVVRLLDHACSLQG